MFMSDRWHYSDFEQWVLDAQVAIGQKSTEDENTMLLLVDHSLPGVLMPWY